MRRGYVLRAVVVCYRSCKSSVKLCRLDRPYRTVRRSVFCVTEYGGLLCIPFLVHCCVPVPSFTLPGPECGTARKCTPFRTGLVENGTETDVFPRTVSVTYSTKRRSVRGLRTERSSVRCDSENAATFRNIEIGTELNELPFFSNACFRFPSPKE